MSKMRNSIKIGACSNIRTYYVYIKQWKEKKNGTAIGKTRQVI